MLGEGGRQRPRAVRQGDAALRRGSRRDRVFQLYAFRQGNGEFGHRRVFKQGAQGQFDPEFGAQPGHDPGGQQRMAAGFEEVLFAAQAAGAQHFAPDAGHFAFGAAARRRTGIDAALFGLAGFGQRAPIQFAAMGQRQLVQRDEGGGQHVVGQPRGEMTAQFRPQRVARLALRRGVEAVGGLAVVAAVQPLQRQRGQGVGGGGQRQVEPAVGGVFAPAEARGQAVGGGGRQQLRGLGGLGGVRQRLRPPGLAVGGFVVGRVQIQPGEEAVDLGGAAVGQAGPRAPRIRGGSGLRRALAQHHVVAIGGQFAVAAVFFQADFYRGDVAAAARQPAEQRRVHQQFLFFRDQRVQLTAQFRPRRAGDGGQAVQQAASLEVPQHAQVAQVAQQQFAARTQPRQRLVHHVQEVGGVGEVLRHGIDDHGVEVVRQAGQVAGFAPLQLHLVQAARGHGAAQALQRAGGEVQAVVALAVRGDGEQQHAAADADFQHPARMQRADAAQDLVAPAPHVGGGNQGVVVGVGPADQIEVGVLGRRVLVDHVEGGQPALFLVLGGGGFQAATLGDIGDQTRLIAFAAHHHGGFRHRRVLAEQGLDFGGFDAEAAQLDLLVGAAAVFQFAARGDAGQIAAAVEAQAAVQVRIRHEALGAQLRLIDVAQRHAGAADVDFAHHARRHRLQRIVQQADAQVGERRADHAAQLALDLGQADAAEGHVHGGFGDAVHIDQPRVVVAVTVQPGLQAAEVQRLAAEDDVAQRQIAFARVCLLGGHQLAEGRRGLAQHGDFFLAQQLVEGVRGAGQQRRHNQQDAAVGQRAPDFPHGEVEGVGVEQRPHFARAELEQLGAAGEQPGAVAVADRHAFRPAGGAGGVDDVGQAVRVVAGRQRRRRRGLRRVQSQQRAGEGRQRRRQRLGAEHGARAAVLQDVADAVGRIGRVHRHIAGAGLERGQHADHQFERGRQPQADGIAGPHAGSRQPPRGGVRQPFQFAVTELPAVAAQRRGVGLHRGETAEGAVHRFAIARGGAQRQRQQGGGLLRRGQRQRGQRRVRLAAGGVQQNHQLFGETLDGEPLEQRGVVGEGAGQAVLGLAHEQLKVEAGGFLAEHRGQPQPVQRRHRRRDVEQGEGDLEQRVAAGVAAGLPQCADQLVVGHRGVFDGIAHDVRLPAGELAEAVFRADAGADHQHIGEEADQRLGFHPLASGQRGADGQVVLARVARQQRLEGGQQQAEQRGALGRRQPAQAFRGVGWHGEAHGGAVEALHRRPGLVGGQLQRGQPG